MVQVHYSTRSLGIARCTRCARCEIAPLTRLRRGRCAAALPLFGVGLEAVVARKNFSWMSALMNVTTWESWVSGGVLWRGRIVLSCEMHPDCNSDRQPRKGGAFPGFGNRVVMQQSSRLQQGRVRRCSREGGGDTTGGRIPNHEPRCGDGHTPVVDMKVNERRGVGGLLPDERP